MSPDRARRRTRQDPRGPRGRPWRILAITSTGALVLLVAFVIGLAASEGQTGTSIPLLVLVAAVFLAVFVFVFRAARAPGRSRLVASAVAFTAVASIVAVPGLVIFLFVELTST